MVGVPDRDISTAKVKGMAVQERMLSASSVDAFYSFLTHEEKSAATIEKYVRDARAFQVFAGVESVTKDMVMRYKQRLIEKGYALRSVNSMLASLHSLFAFLGWGDCRVKFLKVQREAYCAEDRELTKAEYLRLLRAAQTKPQLCLLMQTLCGTGIRVSELRYFTVEAVRADSVEVRCKGKTRMVFVPRKLRQKLLSYARAHGVSSGPIFVTRRGRPLNRSNIWAQMKRLCRSAHVQTSKVFPHNLRKLFARTFYRFEKDIAKLADLLGHSSVNTTRIYLVDTGVEHRRLIERLGLIL